MSDILSLIGNTPMVKLQRIAKGSKADIYCKLEGNNPGGSVKDRAAYSMIKGALDRGELKEGMSLVEPTSGNTGIALALIASLFGVKIELVMPEDATRERVQTMRAFGAKVTLTPTGKGMEGAIDYANARLNQGDCIMLNQFANPDNPKIHYQTTGPEIWRDTNGSITHFVSAMGTTGTIMGVSKYLKEQSNAVTVIGCEPSEGSRIPGIRKWPKAYLPKIFDQSRVDQMIEVSETQAKEMTRRLAKEEGIFCGMSSGGAVHAAVQLASTLDGGTIVCIICDRGDRYLSSDIFE